MVSFLSELAKEVCSSYGEHIDELCVVFQNRRACLYFKHFMAQEIKQATWAPKVLTIEEFVLELNPVQIMEPVLLLFEFFSVYKKSDGTDSFDQFAQWGEILLKDFDEIDAYLVPTDKFFHHLNEAKAIEQWDPKGKALSDFQMRYLRFWESFKDLYHSFREHLNRHHMAYKGMALREVAETIEEKIEHKPWKKIIFAGFNALSLSEEKIFEKLLKLKKARVIWDMDAYYIRNDIQEAGHYIRTYLRDWRISEPQWEKDFLLSERKNIHIIGVAKHVGQAKVAGDIVQKLHTRNASINETAVILADETLLFPMLHSLPDSIEDVNVSMGLSLKFTSLFSLVESLFDLQEHALQFNEIKISGEIQFYHKEVVAILSHPLVQWSDRMSGNPVCQQIIRLIYRENILFLSSSDIHALFQPANSTIKTFFPGTWNNSLDALASLMKIVSFLQETFTNEESTRSDIELESFFRFSSVITLLQSLLKKHETILELKSLRIFLTEILSSTRIPFSGEPIKGLQIMGMLETRTIDFENVIMLSVNENILPASKAQQSMIPFDIKAAFRLPTYKEKDAIFAYNFYRSIQRAKNIYLIYNSETDEFGKGERSRFITQLIHELPKYNPNIKPGDIQESFLSFSSSLSRGNKTTDITIGKNSSILDEIVSLLSYGISPSALNTYIHCSFKFYLRYILKLRETEDTEETMEAGTFGQAIHFVLEILFRPYEGRIACASDIDSMFDHVQPFLTQAFTKFLKNGNMERGKNHLLARVGIKLIENFLKYEKKRIDETELSGESIRVLAVEKEVSCDINLQLNDQKKIIKLKGKMDRIERVGKRLFVIDYKTGRVDNNELNVGDVSELISNPMLAKSFQLLMYGYIYTLSQELDDPQMITAIYPFKKLSNGLKPVSVNGVNILTKNLFTEFEAQLKILLMQLTDSHAAFKQTEDPKRCRNCEFISLCRRD